MLCVRGLRACMGDPSFKLYKAVKCRSDIRIDKAYEYEYG